MIEAYTNQSVTWNTKIATDEYGNDTFTSTTIKARFEYKRRMVMNPKGETIISSATLYTTSAIQTDDTVNFNGVEYITVAVTPVVDLFGSISHYKVMVT